MQSIPIQGNRKRELHFIHVNCKNTRGEVIEDIDVMYAEGQ